jgi:hypothetical protein
MAAIATSDFIQAIVLSLESSQIRRKHNWLKSLSFLFSPALSEQQEFWNILPKLVRQKLSLE